MANVCVYGVAIAAHVVANHCTFVTIFR